MKKTADAKVKKSLIVSYNKLTNDMKLALAEKYPEGYMNYITRYPKPNGEFFYAVSLQTDEANYLIKVEVKIDNLSVDDDIDKSFNDLSGVDSKSMGEDDFEQSDDSENDDYEKKEESTTDDDDED